MRVGGAGQRFHNPVCPAYGADRVGFADLATNFHPARALGCLFEYAVNMRAFENRLAPTIGIGTGAPEMARVF